MYISVIVPLYRGKKYMPGIIRMVEENGGKIKPEHETELIFVNDAPDERISEDELPENSINVRLIQNPENRGIHFSRVHGLKEAKGDYILFLDQDDEISSDYFESQLSHMNGNDLVVCNGYAERSGQVKYLYKYAFMQWTVRHEWFYRRFGNRILSPGQCLIRRDSIPQFWIDHIINENGADDLFLWLLMFSEQREFGINRDYLYRHKYTKVNTSLDTEQMERSQDEILKLANRDAVPKGRKEQSKLVRWFVRVVETLNER